jgi:hypothetical protein
LTHSSIAPAWRPLHAAKLDTPTMLVLAELQPALPKNDLEDVVGRSRSCGTPGKAEAHG